MDQGLNPWWDLGTEPSTRQSPPESLVDRSSWGAQEIQCVEGVSEVLLRVFPLVPPDIDRYWNIKDPHGRFTRVFVAVGFDVSQANIYTGGLSREELLRLSELGWETGGSSSDLWSFAIHCDPKTPLESWELLCSAIGLALARVNHSELSEPSESGSGWTLDPINSAWPTAGQLVTRAIVEGRRQAELNRALGLSSRPLAHPDEA